MTGGELGFASGEKSLDELEKGGEENPGGGQTHYRPKR